MVTVTNFDLVHIWCYTFFDIYLTKYLEMEWEKSVIKIAICDDEMEFCSELEKNIIKVFDERCMEYDIDVFNSGEELCGKIETGDLSYTYDLLFIDIELPEMNGVDIGRYIRKHLKNQIVQIVYVSSKQEYAMELFDFRPLNFLIKPIEENDILTVIEQFQEINEKDSYLFRFKKGREFYKIPINKILYFERKGRKIYVHLYEEEYDYYDSLELIYENLKQYNFLFIHKSYLVNYRFIKIMAYKYVILFDGTKIPISQAKREQIRKEFMKIGSFA